MDTGIPGISPTRIEIQPDRYRNFLEVGQEDLSRHRTDGGVKPSPITDRTHERGDGKARCERAQLSGGCVAHGAQLVIERGEQGVERHVRA